MTKLKYALIGCGKVSIKHLKAALYQSGKKSAIEIAALVDSQPEAPLQLMKACGLKTSDQSGIRLYQDYETMLSVEKPDLAAITTPSGSHAAIGLAALSSGCHILLEKPLTLSLNDSDLLLEAAKNNDLQIAVGHIYRFFPMVQALQADLAAGAFGRVLYGDVKVRWGHDQAYYDQSAWRGTWTHDGGALMNQSIHALDLMIWLLGANPVSVTGRIDRQLHRMEAEDLGFATLQLEKGVWCQLEGTTNTDPSRQEASFFIRCSEGEIRGGIIAGRPYMAICDGRGKNISSRYFRHFIVERLKKEGIAGLKQLGNPHSGLYSDWIDAVNDRRSPIASGAGGRQAVEMVLAAYKSALTESTVRLPLTDFRLEMMKDYVFSS